MVNFNNVEILRAIMHRVSARVGDNEASVSPSDRLLTLDDDAKQIIKDRLVAAFGRQSKSFELDVENDGEDSCFSFVNSLRNTSDEEFISISESIANLLADSQRQPRIPGGYLLVVHCRYENKPLHVLIKAEPHTALGVAEMDVHSIKNIILSPEQKLYKAAYFEQKIDVSADMVLSKDNYRVVLFDSNVNSNKSIAQYFYKDFLGLSISGNAQLQTFLFYTMMEELIWKHLQGLEALDASDALRSAINEANETINPHGVITDVIPLEKRDEFIDGIIEKFPQSIGKDTSLINSKMSRKSIWLSNQVKITAPTEFFEANVSVEEANGEYVVRIQR